MRTRWICAALLLLLAPLGCRSRGELDLAERDMRIQENSIFKLQEYINQYQQMLEDCQAENASLRKQLAEAGRAPDKAQRSEKPRTLRELINSNKPGSAAASSGPAMSVPSIPNIDLGAEFDPTLSIPETTPESAAPSSQDRSPANTNPPAGAAPATEPAPMNSSPADNSPPVSSGRASSPIGELPEPDALPTPGSPDGAAGSKASQLAIRAVGQVRGGANMPGGLLVVVEPRSANGGLARAPEGAKMSLLIVGGVNEEPVGRWDFSAEQTAAAYRAGFGANSGWRFVLPFNKTNDTPQQLKLYARLVLPDGAKLISEREFDADTGASLEEIPAGDAHWLRSRQPIASLVNQLGRDARAAASGFQPARRPTSNAPSSQVRTRSTASSGNIAPAWQPQPAGMAPPASGGTAPAYAPSTTPNWNLANMPSPAAGPANGETSSTPAATSETASGPAAETATRDGRPAWSPYR